MKFKVRIFLKTKVENYLSVNSNYYIADEEEEQESTSIVVHKVDDIIKHINDNKTNKNRLVLIVIGGLDVVLFEMMKAKYTPAVSFNNGMITSIYLTHTVEKKRETKKQKKQKKKQKKLLFVMVPCGEKMMPRILIWIKQHLTHFQKHINKSQNQSLINL